jgi:hypothetical protein
MLLSIVFQTTIVFTAPYRNRVYSGPPEGDLDHAALPARGRVDEAGRHRLHLERSCLRRHGAYVLISRLLFVCSAPVL